MKLRTGETARVGQRVRADREAPARGTWKLFQGREGTVRTLNSDDGEVGVELDGAHARHYTWFLPGELVLRPPSATRPGGSGSDG